MKDTVGEPSNEEVEGYLQEIQKFLEQDRIDLDKYLANFEIIKNESKEIYKSKCKLLGENYLGDIATVSIDKLAPVINRPLGYYIWFISAYPDVVLWADALNDQELLTILGNPKEAEVFDRNQKINFKFLRKTVDAYRKDGKKLECI